MGSLYIPNSIALRNFDSLFKNNTFNFDDGEADISFHQKYVAMHPVGLAFYAALGDIFTMNNIAKKARLDFKIKSIPYIQRMGLFRAMGFKDPITTKLHEETGRFIPLQKISNSNELTTFIKIKSIPYIQRMGLFRAMGFKDPITTKLHEETGRFIPLQKISNSNELTTFIKTIDPILHTTRENSRVIKHVLGITP